jgi:two-component system, chemotaxis family, chemotaxis protein CheY
MKVLVLEDDQHIQTALTQILLSDNHSVSAAFNGQEALNLLYIGPRPDLILTDLGMDHPIDGRKFIAEKNKSPYFKNIPIVVITAENDPADIIDVYAVLKKPFSIEEILRVVHSIARG